MPSFHLDFNAKETSFHGPLARYIKLRVAHAPGMLGTFSPPTTSKRSRHASRHVRHHGYESRMHWHMSMYSSGWTTQAATSTTRLISHIMYIDWLSWYRNFANNNKGNVHDGWFGKIPASVWCPERKSISKRDALTYDLRCIDISLFQMSGCIDNERIHISNTLFNWMRHLMGLELAW